jgi:hypothetical protein
MNRINLSHYFGVFRFTYKTVAEGLVSASSTDNQKADSR